MSGIDHLGFIVAAYAVTTVTLLATVAALIVDNRAQRKILARFAEQESRGQ